MRFCDLFSGVGGFRLALQSLGHTHAWACEIDKFARATYAANFGHEQEGRDITAVRTEDIPDHDILTGGFPCQPFSLLHKGAAGFADPRGQLYREIVRIVAAKRPWCVFLENVPRLSTLKGFDLIAEDFKALGYSFSWKIIDAGLVWPQKRERLYMIGYRDGVAHEWRPIRRRRATLNAYSLLETEPDVRRLSERAWRFLEERRRGGARGCHTWRILSPVCGTLCCSEHGERIYVPMRSGLPRYLTVRERFRLQGFPDSFTVRVSRSQAIKQAGNAVCVPIVKAIAEGLREPVGATLAA